MLSGNAINIRCVIAIEYAIYMISGYAMSRRDAPKGPD